MRNFKHPFIFLSKRFFDSRGYFQELFLKKNFKTSANLTAIAHSKKNVIRGMHFQSPPHEHQKLVYCLQGEIHDVVLDLRVNSTTYGKAVGINLSSKNKG